MHGLLVVSALALVLSLPALAQTSSSVGAPSVTSTDMANVSDSAAEPDVLSSPPPKLVDGPFAASDVIGKKVANADGDAVATIADLLIDEKGTVQQVILDVGGFLGLGSKSVAIDVRRLQPRGDEGQGYTLPMRKEEIARLPAYEPPARE